MGQQDQRYQHARAAVNRAAWSVGSIHARLQAEEIHMTAQYRAVARKILADLETRYSMLSESWQDMRASTPEDLPPRWWKFFACYSDFRDAERYAKVGLIREGLHACPAGQSYDCVLRFRCPALKAPNPTECPFRRDAPDEECGAGIAQA
jgi:hypothetical protein